MASRIVRAAGAVVTRKGGDVLLVHRPAYDDWAFPKGKLDRGEHVVAAAIREVAEETGLDIRLGAPLPAQEYPMGGGRIKHVSYWVARVVGDDDVSGYRVNDEIDDVAWVPWDKAERLLTYDKDRETLAQAAKVRRKTRALVVLRHGKARSRKGWSKNDRRRPLVGLGLLQAERLVPLLAAYDVTAVHTSSSTRCVDTVAPYALATEWPLFPHDALSEQDATIDSVTEVVEELLTAKEGTVLCTHRPVLPTVLDVLGVGDDDTLDPAELLVVHHRKGRVVASERHRP